MRFAIRDDDTNFYTSPAELEKCYGDIWNVVPPTLCLISKVKGNWQYWVHQIYKDKQKTDWKAWENDDEAHPIEDNKVLINFLKEKYASGHLDVGFHAVHHRNEDEVLPAGRSNNYVRGAEFFTTRNMEALIKKETAHLNDLLNAEISVFTPPQNLLSLKGYQAVIAAGLNICGGGIPFFKKEKTISGLLNMAKIASFKAIHKTLDYPRTLSYSHHNEIAYHYPLQPNTPIKTLIDAFENVRQFDGDFVLSTHYVEFDYQMVYDSKRTMKNVLEEFISYIEKYPVKKMSLTKMLSS